MSIEDTRTRDAALTRTTNGWWEVELFERTELPSGVVRMAHVFRDCFENLSVAGGIIRDWLGADDMTEYPFAVYSFTNPMPIGSVTIVAEPTESQTNVRKRALSAARQEYQGHRAITVRAIEGGERSR